MMIAPPGPCPDIGHAMYGFSLCNDGPSMYGNRITPFLRLPRGRHDRYMGKCFRNGGTLAAFVFRPPCLGPQDCWVALICSNQRIWRLLVGGCQLAGRRSSTRGVAALEGAERAP